MKMDKNSQGKRHRDKNDAFFLSLISLSLCYNDDYEHTQGDSTVVKLARSSESLFLDATSNFRLSSSLHFLQLKAQLQHIKNAFPLETTVSFGTLDVKQAVSNGIAMTSQFPQSMMYPGRPQWVQYRFISFSTHSFFLYLRLDFLFHLYIGSQAPSEVLPQTPWRDEGAGCIPIILECRPVAV